MPHPTIHGDLRISLFHVERSSYRSLQLVDNTHPYWALSYVVEGHVRTVCRGHTFPVQPGDIMIHPPDILYSELASGSGTHEWLLLEAASATHIDLFRRYPIAPVVRITSPTEFSHLFTDLLKLWQSTETSASAANWLHMLALTSQLLSLVLRSWEEAGSVSRPAAMVSTEDRFTRVIDYMADHLAEKLSRNLLADMMGLHPVYFDRLFRQTYTISPMQMVREMRLQRARSLLESTGDTLETIAYICGLGSGSSFVRVFQQRFGQTPGDYRSGLKRVRNQYAPFG